jgi:integrase
MGRKIIKLEVREESSSRFVVAVRQALTHTKRVRRVFTNRHEANLYIENMVDFGYVQAENIRCNGGRIEVSKGTVNNWAQKFLFELKNAGKLSAWRTSRHLLRCIGKRLGNRDIASITREDVNAYLNTVKGSSQTKWNHQRKISQLFSWAMDLDDPPITRNPVRRKDRVRIKRKPPVLLVPQQFAACIEWAKANNELELLAHLCIGGFHGVRTEEIIRMDWRDLDWANGIVHVLNPKDVTGARPRHLAMNGGLRKHLQPFAQLSGPILLGGDRAEDKSNAVNLRMGRHRKPMLKAVGLSTWPRNTLRHSFKSYDEALHESYSHTQREMGHTNPAMTRYGYGTDQAGGFYIDKGMAERWFAV